MSATTSSTPITSGSFDFTVTGTMAWYTKGGALVIMPGGGIADSGGGGGGGGIVNFSPFTTTGTPANGNALTVTRSSGTFAAKSFGSGAPQLFDMVSKQYVNGVNQDYYSGFADGTDIAHLAYIKQSKDFGTTDVMKYYTSRTRRTSFDTASYATVNMVANGKGCLGLPRWPGAYGTQNNTKIYFSVWFRSKNPYVSDGSGGGGDGTNKICRITDTTFNSTIQGDHFVARTSAGWPTVDAFTRDGFYTISGQANVWTRFEMWADVTNALWNPWWQQAFLQWSYSGFGGIFETCHPVDVLYAPNSPANSYWDPATQGMTFDAVCPGQFPYDDGHGFSAGNDLDIAQVYVDPNIERFELSDSSSWDVGPTSTKNREIQGQWSRSSSTQCAVTISQGQFSTLSGQYLYYVNGRNTAEKVCQFT